jgi:nucleotide-binding universal stress UspA family protein
MHVLVGVGAADPIEELLPKAVASAREAGDELTVAVMPAPDGGGDLEAAERRARTVLDEESFEAELRVLSGHPGSELVEFVESGPFDRLAICGGKRSPLGKIQTGNTTEFVLLNAGTTVTLLR